MKKILFLAMVATAMVSCSQNEEFENAAQKAEINFGTVVSNTTRAAVTNLETLKQAGVGFTVYAYNTGANELVDATSFTDFISGKKATFSDNKWSIADGPYYWPLTDNIQFFAYGNEGTGAGAGTLAYIAPTAITAPATAIEYPAITYTVADDVDKQTDLVVASVSNANKTNNESGVSFVFSHALTQVNFTLKPSDAKTYKLKSLAISGVKNKGTYNFGTPTWDALEGNATYTHTESAADGLAIDAAGTEINTAWMLMPQGMPATGAAINLEYDVFDGQKQVSAVNTSVDLATTTAWGVGKKMRYTLTLSNGLVEISLIDPEVGAWNTPEDNVEK